MNCWKESLKKFVLERLSGINEKTAEKAIKSGADTLVMGSAFFKSADKKGLIEKFQK